MTRPLPVPSRAGRLPARVNRQASREIKQIKGGLTVARAADQARVRLVAGVTEDALVAATAFSQIEALGVQITPHAAGRLKAIADMGTVGLARIVQDASES
jgi:hypothetical protein